MQKMMRAAWLLIFLALALCSCAARAEKPPVNEAKARAAFYQRETCAELQSRHWRITTNDAGRIVAARSLGPNQPGYDPLGYACLTITLRPKSVTDTECGVNVVAYIYGYGKGQSFRKTYSEPFPLNNPETLRDINAALAKARQRLFAAHPEYAPH